VNREDDERRDGLACYKRRGDCCWSKGRGLSDAGRNVSLLCCCRTFLKDNLTLVRLSWVWLPIAE